MKRLTLYLLLLLAAVACVPGLEPGMPSGASLEGAPVTVRFSVPDVGVGAPTKGVDGTDGKITEDPYLDPDRMYLVVCGVSQSIKYIRKATLVSVTPDYEIPEAYYPPIEGDRVTNLYTFEVQLEISDTERTIHFLANIDENQLETGTRSYQTLPALLSYERKQAYWQKLYLPFVKAKIDETTHQPVMVDGSYVADDATQELMRYIPLVRNFAKLQVTNEAENFELHSYAVINFPTRGSVTPYRSNAPNGLAAFDFNPPSGYRFSGYERNDFETLETTLEYPGNLPAGIALDDFIPPASAFINPATSDGRVIAYDGTDPDLGFYIYERGIPTEQLLPTFIIICGKFEEDDNWYFYRLDLMESKVEDGTTQSRYYPIYRNFRYNIQMNRISSEGLLTPEAAANSSLVKDISADISMRHLSDISNGTTRLVVEPFMKRTYSGPSPDGYYELMARFYNDVYSDVPNTVLGTVRVELEPMADGSEDILILYDDYGNPLPSGSYFFPAAVNYGEVEGVRLIHFNTKEPGDETKTQKIKIIGHNPGNDPDLRLYREVEITLQNRQTMLLSCIDPLPATLSTSQVLSVEIPSGLPESMFPLDFIVEPEHMTLTPDNSHSINMPVVSGKSIATMDAVYRDSPAFQFIRTLTWSEYENLPVSDGRRKFQCFFKPNRPLSATTIWVYNEFFHKARVSFENETVPVDYNYFRITAVTQTQVKFNYSAAKIQYRVDDGDWMSYANNTFLTIAEGHTVYFKAGSQASMVKTWSATFSTQGDGQFTIGGNIASLIAGDDYAAVGESITGFGFRDFMKAQTGLLDAYDLVLPMKTCATDCYKSFFDGCTNLQRGPQELPATALGNTCYRNMFYGCSSVTYVPALIATTLKQGCYQRMFVGCSSLTSITMLAKTYRADSFKTGSEAIWYDGVASEGVIWMDPATNAKNDGTAWAPVIPTGWTVKYYGVDD